VKIVRVKWIDSSFCHGWHNKDTLTDDHIATCESVGFLARKDNTEVVIVAGMSETGYHDSIAIPRRCVLEIKVLQ